MCQGSGEAREGHGAARGAHGNRDRGIRARSSRAEGVALRCARGGGTASRPGAVQRRSAARRGARVRLRVITIEMITRPQGIGMKGSGEEGWRGVKDMVTDEDQQRKQYWR